LGSNGVGNNPSFTRGLNQGDYGEGELLREAGERGVVLLGKGRRIQKGQGGKGGGEKGFPPVDWGLGLAASV